jgi:hypothetical protein
MGMVVAGARFHSAGIDAHNVLSEIQELAKYAAEFPYQRTTAHPTSDL